MSQGCEVCSAMGRAQQGRTRRIVVSERLVALCTSHARVLGGLPVAGTEELRAAFREKDGQRSLVGRREALDRRVFPPRPEARRRGGGRRAGD